MPAAARAVEHDLSERSAGCPFTKAAAGRLAAKIDPAERAITHALAALRTAIDSRLKRIAWENKTFGWIGWRGSRTVRQNQLTYLARDAALTATRADLAFARLSKTLNTLNKVSVTCE